jgi:hypothetical protein
MSEAVVMAAPRARSRSFFRALGRLAWLFLRHPGRAIDELRAEPRAMFLGLAFLLAGLVVYTAVAARIYSLGYRPHAVPLTMFPADTWYLLQAFITIPVGVVAAFAFAAIAYAICRAWGGAGTFDATFGASAFSLHLPMLLFMWIPDIFVAPALYGRAGHGLPWPMWIEVLRIFLLPLPWAGIVATLGLSRVHGLTTPRAALAVLVAAVPSSLMTAAFLR